MTKVREIDIDRIKSRWFSDILSDGKPDQEYIRHIQDMIRNELYIPPIIVVREGNDFCVVNGHHRLYAFKELGRKTISCVILAGSFEDSAPLRQAELLLKKYDESTGHRYRFSSYLDRWAASVDHREYADVYRPSLGFRLYRKIRELKNRLFRKRHY